jgi:acyl-CoA synthetase (AMP-forming)/AMP-acid ligase II
MRMNVVWEKFRSRFGVATISEFFASTEGVSSIRPSLASLADDGHLRQNGSLFNVNTNHLGAGAVGHEGTLASFMRKSQQVRPFPHLSLSPLTFSPQTIVRVDALTEEPARGADGFCIRAEPNEDGELICVIINDSPFQAFAGYAGNAAGTEKKILRDVFVKGDMYFRTGDLLKKCPDGFLYFGDRLGDTFRWKSENVSTLQVSEALGAVVDEANVYGVLGSSLPPISPLTLTDEDVDNSTWT